MKSLLEKAKPELLAGLAKFTAQYPSSGDYIRKALSELYFVNHMTIQVWVDIRSIWFSETNELSNHPWDLFIKED